MYWRELEGEEDGGGLVSTGVGREMGKTCTCGEKNDRGCKQMQAVWPMALESGSSSGKEGAALEAAVTHVGSRKDN